MSSLIDSTEVHDTFLGCLFKDGEDRTNFVEAHGVNMRVGFHPDRLKDAAAKVRTWLDALPVAFRISGGLAGGGWSFLQACEDRDGNQWTGLHQTMDELFTLGIAIEYARFLVPRDMWAMFPGGMPYLSVGEKS